MAGEEEILKSIQYNNFIYLFNDPSDVVLAKKRPNNTDPPSLKYSGEDFYPLEDYRRANRLLKELAPTTTLSTTQITPESLGLQNTQVGSLESNPIIFRDFDGQGDFPVLFSADENKDLTRNTDLGNSFLNFRAANITKGTARVNYKRTNDFGHNPLKKHKLQVSTQNGLSIYAVSHEFKTMRASIDALTGQQSYQLIPEDLGNVASQTDLDDAMAAANKSNGNFIVNLSSPSGPFLYNVLDAFGDGTEGDEQANALKTMIGIPSDDPLDNSGVLKLEPYTKVAGSLTDGTIYSEFTFTQKFYFGINIPTPPAIDAASPGPQVLAKRYLSYISTPPNEATAYDNTLIQTKYEKPYNDQFKIIDNSCTKIGVPYDSHSIIIDKVNLNSFGVRNTAPTYESFYNYFDPQYEPVVLSIINQGIINENSLPSVYDFVYLPLQEEFMRTFLDLPNDGIPIKDTNISNLNTYLDSLSTFYGDYIAGSDIAQDDEDPAVLPPSAVGSITPRDLGFYIDPYLDQPATQDLDNIFLTPKSEFLKKIEVDSNGGFADQLIESKKNHIPKWIEEIKSGIYFCEKTMPTFNEALEFTNRFPFASTINIPQEQRGPIAKLFSEYGLLDAINTHAASLVVPNEYLTRDPNQITPGSRVIKTYAKFYGGMINGYTPRRFNMFNGVKLKTFRMNFSRFGETDFLEGADATDNRSDLYLDNFENVGIETPKNVFIYSGEESTSSTTAFLNILSILKSQQLKTKLYNFFEAGGMRTPRDIQNGKFAHQETLMYEIAKYQIVEDQEQFIQSIFLPIVNQDSLKYVDTQVVPYKNYFYKIFAHKVIVGTRYKPDDIEFFEDQVETDNETVIQFQNLKKPEFLGSGFSGKLPENNLIYEHQYLVEPYLQFVRVPYYNTPMVNVQTDAINFTRIEDLPPTPPEVQVIPYRNVKNKILFLLNNSTGEFKSTVIPILDTDLDIFDLCAVSQGVNLPSKDYLTELQFKSDDIPRTYTIFRMEKRPSSYKEFFEDDDAIQFSLSDGEASFVDNIIPNKDYYYCFRTTDVHGKISNPTIVYKVIIISEINSAPYVKIETFDPRDEAGRANDEKLSTTKTFQKYLLLGLNRSQNTVNYPNMEFNEAGGAQGAYDSQPVDIDSAVFGKKYKLRITSKQTGRKIDINIDFKNPKNIINNV